MMDLGANLVAKLPFPKVSLLICVLFIPVSKYRCLKNPPLPRCHQFTAIHLKCLRKWALAIKSDSFFYMDYAIKCGAATYQISNLCNKTHLLCKDFCLKLWDTFMKFKVILKKCFSYIIVILKVLISYVSLKKKKKKPKAISKLFN